MTRLLCLLVLVSSLGYTQKLKKADKAVLNNLKTHIGYLADDKLEGRRTGTPGEKLAYEYISNQFAKTGLIAKGDNGTYIQAFEVNEGKQIDPSSYLIINDKSLLAEKDFFPFVFSPNASLEAAPAIALQERGTVWFWDLKDQLEENKNNPHFDLMDAIKTKINEIGRAHV